MATFDEGPNQCTLELQEMIAILGCASLGITVLSKSMFREFNRDYEVSIRIGARMLDVTRSSLLAFHLNTREEFERAMNDPDQQDVLRAIHAAGTLINHLTNFVPGPSEQFEVEIRDPSERRDRDA